MAKRKKGKKSKVVNLLPGEFMVYPKPSIYFEGKEFYDQGQFDTWQANKAEYQALIQALENGEITLESAYIRLCVTSSWMTWGDWANADQYEIIPSRFGKVTPQKSTTAEPVETIFNWELT